MRRIVLMATLAGLAGGQGSASEPDVLPPNAGAEQNACGHVAVYTLARLIDRDVRWEDVKEAVGPPDAAGFHSFADLERGARSLGMTCVGVNARWEDLANFPMPAIVQTRFFLGRKEPHFAVLLRVTDDGVHLLDAPFAPIFAKKANFSKMWTGERLVFPAATGGDTGLREELAADATAERWRRYSVYASLSILFIAGALFVWYIASPAGSGLGIRQSLIGRQLVGNRYALIGAASVGACVTVYFALAPMRHPVLVIRQSQIDLGDVKPGNHVVEVAIANEGTAPLVIRGVRSNCTCAVAEPPALIEAGASEVMKVEINARAGVRSATIIIDANDAKKAHPVNFVWFGKSRPMLYPNRLECCDEKGDLVRRTLHVVYPGGPSPSPPEVLSLTCGNTPVPFEVRPEIRELEVGRGNAPSRRLQGFAILVQIDIPNSRTPEKRSYVLVLRSGGEEYKYSIPVVVSKHAPIEPETDRVVLVIDRNGHAQDDRTLRVRSDMPVGKLAVQSPVWCACRLEPDADGTALLHIALHPSAGRGALSGVIEITAAGHERVKAAIAVRTFAMK